MAARRQYSSSARNQDRRTASVESHRRQSRCAGCARLGRHRQSYSERLGATGIGDIAEIRDQKVQVAAVTRGIRSFTTTPYVFTTIDRARSFIGTAAEQGQLFHRAHRPDRESRNRPGELRHRPLIWRFSPPTNFAAAAARSGCSDRRRRGAVCRRAARHDRRHRDRRANALFQHQRPHQRICDAARHRLLGGYIHKVIIFQALLSAAIGFSIAAGIGLLIVMRPPTRRYPSS